MLNNAEITKRLTSILDHFASTGTGGPNARLAITRSRSAIERFAPPASAYRHEVDLLDSKRGQWAEGLVASQILAVVQALRDDYADGGLATVAELVHADMFDDFLDAAAELHAKGFLAPSAVVAGTVLENHVRKMAAKTQIPLSGSNGAPKHLDALTIELRKADVITEVQRKAIQSWYGQRNEAAHVGAENLVKTEVERMIDGIRDFVARFPA